MTTAERERLTELERENRELKRAKARGLDQDACFPPNLLEREARAADVAQAGLAREAELCYAMVAS